MTKRSNKAALVTGGSRGIGAAIASRLASEGTAVAITYAREAEKARTVVERIQENGGRAIAIAADNADAGAVLGAVDQTVAAFGRLDILVNNAGIFIAKPVDEITLDDLDQTIAVNTRAVFIASQAAARHMVEGGRIIMIGSNLAERAPSPGLSIYSMSKAALTGLTKGLARDLGPRGITVNIVHPGSTDTDMNPVDGEFADYQKSLMALPAFSPPDDVAALVAWIASEESRSVTGAAFLTDRGANI